jgi:hypothetical protein
LTKIVTRVIALGFLGITLTSAQTVWVADSLQRVRPTDNPGSGFNIALYAAKGESESFQVVVRGPSSGVSGVNLTTSGLTGPGGATISAQNFTFYREYYVYVTNSSPDFGVGNRPMGPGWYPDGLIPFKNPSTGADLTGTSAAYNAVPFTIAANHNQPFWIDINVPRTAVAGNYTGNVVITSSLGTTSVNVTLKVWNFTLPVAPRMKSSFGFHNSYGSRANNQVLLDHRIQPFVTNAPDVSALQPHGLQISGLPFFNQSSGCTIETPPSVTTIANAVKTYPAGFPTYVYPADEVSGCANLTANLQLWAQVAHAAGTKMLVTVPPDPTLLSDGTSSGRSAVDIFAMVAKQYCTGSINTLPCVERSTIPLALAKGNEIWSYVEQEQDNYSPRWLIDFPPINYRIMPGFVNQHFGFTGMLSSNVMHWSSDPWNNVEAWKAAGYTFPGDGVLVYPGTQVGLTTVVPSMRLKFIRDGVDDFDYIALLKDKGQTSLVNSVLASIVPDWHNWTKSTATLQSARIQLGQELDSLAGGSSSGSVSGSVSGTSLVAPSNPWPVSGATAPATSLTLQCSAVSGATQYQIYFGTSSTALVLRATVSAIGSTVREAVLNLGGGITYYWKVVATNGTSSASGPVWSFKTPSSTTATIVFQTESLPAATSGPENQILTWAGFTNGAGTLFVSNKMGDYVTYTATVPKAGAYDVKVAVKKYFVRGQWQLTVAGIRLGPTVDEYDPNEVWGEFDLGTTTIASAGPIGFKFTIVGKNSLSTDYKVGFDYIKLTPK